MLGCLGFSLVVVHRFSSSGTLSSCLSAGGILVAHPGIKPVSPAFQGEFLTTGLLVKSLF